MRQSIEVAMPDKAVIRRGIISDVLKLHRLSDEEFFSRSKMAELVAARKDAANRLRKAGFTPGHIAKILRRERTTVVHYFSDGMVEVKRGRGRLYKILYSLPDDVRGTIEELAKAEEASPYTILREWISERARHEAAARARAA